MKMIIMVAAGLLSTGAIAQTSTMQTTTTTTKPAPAPAPTMMNHSTTTSMRHSESHMRASDGHKMRHHMRRKCYNQMRHGHKVRVCRSRY